MAHTLLLRLPAPGQEDTEWLSIDESGALATAKQRGPLTLAAAAGRNSKVIVLVPATQLLLAEPELPPGSGVKLARAVPFALEEQLTEDIDQLCFALGRRRPDGRTPVAVVGRALLQGWIAELVGAGIEPTALYADISLMPENPGQTLLWIEGARLAVRRPGSPPFAVELTPVSEALVIAGVIADPLAASAEPKIPESAVLYVTREDWLRIQDEFESLAERFDSFKVQLLTDGPLPWLGRSLLAADAINLLQGEFLRTSDSTERWRRWRVAAALGAALLLTHVAAAAFQIHRANRESAALDAEIAAVFSATMPNETPQNPRAQMQARLDRVRRTGLGAQEFLHTLEALAQALSSAPKTEIQSLSYREQALDLKVSAPSLAALSQLSQVVSRRGLTAEIQSSSPIAGGIEAQMQIRGQGAKGHR